MHRQRSRKCVRARVYRVEDVAVAARRVCNEERKLYTVAWSFGVRLGVVDVRVRRRRGAGAQERRSAFGEVVLPATGQTAVAQRRRVSRQGSAEGLVDISRRQAAVEDEDEDTRCSSPPLAWLRCRFSIQQATFALWA